MAITCRETVWTRGSQHCALRHLVAHSDHEKCLGGCSENSTSHHEGPFKNFSCCSLWIKNTCINANRDFRDQSNGSSLMLKFFFSSTKGFWDHAIVWQNKKQAFSFLLYCIYEDTYHFMLLGRSKLVHSRKSQAIPFSEYVGDWYILLIIWKRQPKPISTSVLPFMERWLDNQEMDWEMKMGMVSQQSNGSLKFIKQLYYFMSRPRIFHYLTPDEDICK